jgi:hypothetical protein
VDDDFIAFAAGLIIGSAGTIVAAILMALT